MDRTAGSSLVGLGGVIAVIGALLKYAVTVTSTHGFNINTAGLILFVAGIVIFGIGLIALVTGSRRRVTIREDVRRSPQGQYRVRQRDDLG